MKNAFGFTILLLFNLQCCWQVLQTSTDPEQQFSAPFKAGNSRQVQICYKPTVQRQRKLQHFLFYSSMGETGVSMNLNHCALTRRRSLLCERKHFHLATHKLLCFVLTEWNNAVITKARGIQNFIHTLWCHSYMKLKFIIWASLKVVSLHLFKEIKRVLF